MDPRTKSILDDIAKLKADNDADTLDAMKDYWDGVSDGIKLIQEVLNKLKIDMINPVREAFKEKENEPSI